MNKQTNALQLGSRPASDHDLDWLLNLRLRTMSAYLEASGDTLSTADQLSRITWRFDAIRVLTLAGEPVGMSKILREPPIWKLVQIQCLPEHQGTGIGTRVITDLLAEAAAAGCAVELSVLKVNPARGLYQRLGFEITEEKSHSFTMRAEP